MQNLDAGSPTHTYMYANIQIHSRPASPSRHTRTPDSDIHVRHFTLGPPASAPHTTALTLHEQKNILIHHMPIPSFPGTSHWPRQPYLHISPGPLIHAARRSDKTCMQDPIEWRHYILVAVRVHCIRRRLFNRMQMCRTSPKC